MKVLLIDVNCKKGSTGKIVYDLYQQLKDDGHEAAICYGRGELVAEKNIFKFGLDWETNIHAGLARITGLNGHFSPLSTKRLIHFIEKFDPDVVHIHELHAYFVNIKPLLRYLKKKNIKIVWTFHCEYMYTGKCGCAFDCQKWKTECKHCPAIKEYPKSICFDFTKKMYREKKKLLEDINFIIVTPSKWLANRVKESFLKEKEIIIIANGIDTKHIFFPKSNLDIDNLKKMYGIEKKKIILSVAPNIMSENKGGKKIIEISKKFSGENIHFVLIGNDKNENIAPNVSLISKTSNLSELALWYSAADAFLLCSTQETFSMTCAEAIACGTSVIGFNAGAPETVFQQPCAIFFDRNNIDGLVKAIRCIKKTNETTEIIRDTALKLYDTKVMYHSYLKVYQNTNI